MIFFTSDTHFFHNRIIDYCDRPFRKMVPPGTIEIEPGIFNDEELSIPDVESMNEHLIAQWNAKISKNDTVYHLGDFGFSPRAKTQGIKNLQNLANRLRGKIILIRGNHDTNIDSIKRFETVKDIHVIHSNNTRFVLCHYPMRSWQFMNRGSIHLFGHCHSNMPDYNMSVDIGVDNIAKILAKRNNTEKLKEYYRPFSVEEVLEYARDNLSRNERFL